LAGRIDPLTSGVGYHRPFRPTRQHLQCRLYRRHRRRAADRSLSLKDAKKTKPGSVPLGHLSRLKLRYKAASKARKGTNPFTGEPATFKAKPATLQPRFTAGKAFKDEASKYFKKKMK
jgi:nucleoid DNA-binding protein